MSLFFLLLFSSEVKLMKLFFSIFQTLPQFSILASTATYLERVFVGVFTATRFLAILTAGIVHPAAGIFISLFIVFVGSLVLVFTQQISAAAVWAGVILQAVNFYIQAYVCTKGTYRFLYLFQIGYTISLSKLISNYT